MLGLVDDKLCSLRLLLRNLLRLDRRGVLLAKGEVRDRDVVELEVELARAGEEVRPDPLGDCLQIWGDMGRSSGRLPATTSSDAGQE